MGRLDNDDLQSGWTVFTNGHDKQIKRKKWHKRLVLPLFMVTLSLLTVTLVMPIPALAWDSIEPFGSSNSHWRMAKEAIANIQADYGSSPLWANFAWGAEYVRDYSEGGWFGDTYGEDVHKRTLIDGDLIVGNNGGTNYPDRQWQQIVIYYRLWQSTGNEDYRQWAYEELGRLVHAIEDQSCPPHAWYAMHGSGSAHGGENFETVSYFADYTPIFPYMEKPSLNDPWEYYYWLKDWTVKNMDNSFWQQYWTLGGYGSVEYNGEDGSEAWLMCVQWGATQQTIYWFLVDAQMKLDDPSYTVEDALGDGIRVVLYADPDYNTKTTRNMELFGTIITIPVSPEYLYSQAIVYEPGSNYGVPMLDGNFYKTRNGGWDAIESSDLGFMADIISSIEMRGDQALKVTLYSGEGFTGERLVLEDDIPNLAAMNFNDKAKSMRIEWDPYPPSITVNSPDKAVYILNEQAVWNWTATDTGSGISSCDGPLVGSPINTSMLGTHTYTINATDNAGNKNSVKVSYSVVYAYELTTPSSAKLSHVRLGSTVPVKFTLKDAAGLSMTNVVAELYLAKQSATNVWGDEITATSISMPKDSNLFRYDAQGGQYMYNLDTKSLSAGTWQLRIKLDDGTTHTMDIQIVESGREGKDSLYTNVGETQQIKVNPDLKKDGEKIAPDTGKDSPMVQSGENQNEDVKETKKTKKIKD